MRSFSNASVSAVSSMRLLSSTPAHLGGVTAVASLGGLLPSHAALVCSSGYDGAVCLWRASHDGSFIRLGRLRPGGSAVFSLALRGVGERTALLICGSNDRRASAYLLHGPSLSSSALPPPLWVTPQHTGWVRAIALAQRPQATRPHTVFSVGTRPPSEATAPCSLSSLSPVDRLQSNPWLVCGH